MSLNITTKPLSHEEQKFYLYMEHAGVSSFKVSEIDEKKSGLSREHLYVIIGRLEKKGWITGVGKGVYLRLPADAALDGRAYLEDPFEVGLKMYSGYLAFQSALRIHGLSEHLPFTVFIATKNKSETLPLLDHYEIKAVKIGSKFTGFEKKGKYKISTIAKTFFDCFSHPQYAGGYSEILKSLHKTENMDWTEMEEYLAEFGSSSLCQKIGYMVSLLQKNTEYKLPAEFIKYLKSRIKNKTRLGSAAPGGKYVRDWMVMDSIGERKLLSWWYNG